MFDMRRREFITLLGGAAAAWPLVARAQQADRMRRIGVLLHLAADDPEGQARHAAFLQGLQQSGWSAGRNVRIDTRWGASETDRRRYAEELVALAPDAILASNSTATLALQAATSTVPIVFVNVVDPVGAGFVASLARPGGNANAVLELGEIQAATRTLGLAVATSEIRRGEDIVSAFEALKGRADAIYVVADPLVFSNRARIHTLAMAARLPAIYNSREYVEMGGLMSYGPNFPDMFRRAADMVDKILRGVKPGDLPVEQPTQFDLVINLTTAKALSLDVPPTLLARADEVIE